MQQYNLKKGIPLILMCYLIWGFQALYFYLCKDLDTFFILASRIIWAAVFCFIIVALQGKTSLLLAAFKNKKLLLRETAAMLLLFSDWGVYLWAVQNGKVMDCSLGYYIQPVVVFAFGALIFHEKMNWRHLLVIAVILVGIVLSAKGFGGVPYVTITLAFLFSIYAAIKKSLELDSIVSTTLEIILMIPFALVILLVFYRGENGLGGLDFKSVLLLIGSGIITAVPMLFYSCAVKYLPLMTAGICQYLSPTLAILCGHITGEVLTRDKLVSFIFVWIGIILYTANMFYDMRKARNCGD